MDTREVTITHEWQQVAQAMLAGESGAESRLLEIFADHVISEAVIPQALQALANVVILKCVLDGQLPVRKTGRKKGSPGLDGYEVAWTYFNLRDSGTSAREAADHLARRFHRDERHLLRIVREHRHSIGETKAERQRRREWYAMCAEMRDGDPPKMPFEVHVLTEEEIWKKFDSLRSGAIDQAMQVTRMVLKKKSVTPAS